MTWCFLIDYRHRNHFNFFSKRLIHCFFFFIDRQSTWSRWFVRKCVEFITNATIMKINRNQKWKRRNKISKSSKKSASESKCEKIIKTIEICMRNWLVVSTNTRKNMKKRFRIFVRNLIARHESWYLQTNDMINHLKIFETRKSWNRLIEMRKLLNVLNFWSK